MKRIFLCGLIALVYCAATLQAQTDSPDRYRRSSLYPILIKYPEKTFSAAIEEVYKSIPLSDKFNSHDLKFKIINAGPPRKNAPKDLSQLETTKHFITTNNMGRRLVAKWFNHDNETGAFDLDLIRERGLFDASHVDIQIAQASARGRAMLQDAGEELIGNTYVIFNDIQYINKEDNAQLAKLIFMSVAAGAATFADELSGNTPANNTTNTAVAISQLASATAFLGGTISDAISGFSVTVTSYLYRLDWNDDIAGTFYEKHYADRNNPSSQKSDAFNRDRTTFTMTFVGAQTVQSGKTSIKGTRTNEDMIRKVCTRAIDMSVVELQRKHDEFKIKEPLFSTSPITAKIGVREGITEKSKFEVLEKREDANGRTTYRRVGIVQPIRGKIWDNRYMAVEDDFAGANLEATEFKKISGNEFHPGMLIREIK